MKRGKEVVARARALVGTRFVAQGRDAAIGLDCVGLVLAAHGVEASGMPDDYRLSGAYRAWILEASKRLFRRVPRTRTRLGDVLLFKVGARQWHLGLWTGGSVIHADIASRTTVERPGAPPWPVAAVLRARTRLAKGG